MCEHYVVRSAEPFRLDELWPFTEKLEHFGLAGFGWGAAWTTADGGLASYRDVRAFADDPGRERVGAVETTSALVHLRRPSRLSTLALPDTQPFDDPAGRYAFSHNGDLRDYKRLRATYREQGRIHGRADTEVGRPLARGRLAARASRSATSSAPCTTGSAARPTWRSSRPTARRRTTPGNGENPVFSFRLGRIGVVSTGIYSLDRSLFRFVAAGATERRFVPLRTTVSLDPHGAATAGA